MGNHGSTIDALLAAVLAEPEDDAARLVYADALQAAGDPRGELVAVQCELARLGCGPSDRLFLEWVGDAFADETALAGGRIAKLRAREAALLKKHGAAFHAACLPRGVAPARVTFWRGFPERVAWDLRARVDGGVEAVAARTPLDYVMPSNAKSAAELADFLARPALARVREIYDVHGHGLAPYADAPLPGLRRLLLNHTGGPHELALLRRAKWLPRLTGLVLGGFSLADSAADAAALVAKTPKLEELQLVDTRIGAAALGALSLPKTLRVLALRHAKLGPGEIAPLLAELAASGLAALDLRTNKLGAADTKALGAGFAALRVLDLGNNDLPRGALAALASGEGLGALRSLGLQKSGVTDATLATLAKSPLFARLHALDLRKNALTDAAIPALARAKSLRTLHVGGNGLTPKGKKALQETRSLASAKLYV
ncbi:MAG: TIGR02996 domain-containing protein [Labilithrix sp.]|nr:TIGR02996 domain-containing protein [Labilithrix sp.]MCW5813067.1 TIGR02996 domain-containing protein [Labilithrix sp.]